MPFVKQLGYKKTQYLLKYLGPYDTIVRAFETTLDYYDTSCAVATPFDSSTHRRDGLLM